MFDLVPAARQMGALVGTVTDDQLTRPTPCPDLRVGDLIDHIGMFAVRFAESARKDTGDRSVPPRADLANLGADWRDRIPRDLVAMATAWGEPDAWTGATVAGNIEMPAEVVGLVVLDELVVHGWDLAAATQQPFAPEPEAIEGALAFASTFGAERDGSLFGPIVPVDEASPPIDRLLGITGRDPGWSPPG